VTQLYYCKACKQIDPEGVEGHYTRCTTIRKVVNKEGVVVHKVVQVVVQDGSSRHGKYADAEKRKAYRREWMKAHKARGT
jgi:hypothetical protein